MENLGKVESVKNEICIVTGLTEVGLSNVVSFSSGGQGIVLGFAGAEAQIIMFKDYRQVKKGDLVRIVDDTPKVSAGEALLGRVIDPLGEPLDGLGAIDKLGMQERKIETAARPIYQRKIIDKPLKTGYLIIDSQIPIGLGQRELLLGEHKSGQDEIAVDILCNQARLNTGIIGVYVIIDAETAAAKRRIERLKKNGALKNTVVILGSSAQSASLNYIAPMVGASIAEWFADKGKDVVLVFDDLTKHAKVYRQLSLLLNRPASREAYPGDIFYLHSRLLERSGAFSDAVGGGTITALPIVETQTEEATDYITTNLMSITDGHVLFRQALANKGIRPPIDSGFSVSRIGGRAQIPLIRDLSDQLKAIVIKYAEIEHFLAFGSDMNSDTRTMYELGRRAYAMFYQSADDCYDPLQQVVLMFFVVSKAAIQWSNEQIMDVKKALLTFITKPPYNSLLSGSVLSMTLKDAETALTECMRDFRKHPDTPKPETQHAQLAAETETITGILQEGEEMFNAKA